MSPARIGCRKNCIRIKSNKLFKPPDTGRFDFFLLTAAFGCGITMKTYKTVEAEITVGKGSTESPGCWEPGVYHPSNGPLRVRGNGFCQSISQREGMRQLPEMCWHLTECAVQVYCEPRWYRGFVFNSSLAEGFLCQGRFFYFQEVCIWARSVVLESTADSISPRY